YVTADRASTLIRDTLPNAPIGSVFGPFNEGTRMTLIKLSGIKMEADSVRASHILINVQDGDTAKINDAKATLDSIKGIATKENFAQLAEEYSEDFGSAANGGDLDWFTRGKMVAAFETAAFANEVGEMVIVESQFGVHLIYITDKTAPKPNYLLSIIDRRIEPSKNTADAVYKHASKFALSATSIDDFQEDTENEVLIERFEEVRLDEDVIGRIEDGREIVRWIYDAQEGDISDPFETNNFFAIVALESINEEGTMSFEKAKNLIYQEVMNQKKTEMIMADLADFTSIEEAAQALGSPIKSAENVTFSQSALPGGLGREMAFLGTVYTLEKGEVSGAIKGNRGVFVVRLDSKTPAENIDVASIKRQQSNTMSSAVQSKAYNALQQAAGIVDKRARYY
ncbi:MAG: peptidylprolyl isomerase, partial [Salibacteraceae bacterium]